MLVGCCWSQLLQETGIAAAAMAARNVGEFNNERSDSKRLRRRAADVTDDGQLSYFSCCCPRIYVEFARPWTF